MNEKYSSITMYSNVTLSRQSNLWLNSVSRYYITQKIFNIFHLVSTKKCLYDAVRKDCVISYNAVRKDPRCIHQHLRQHSPLTRISISISTPAFQSASSMSKPPLQQDHRTEPTFLLMLYHGGQKPV